jgi:hypothetical protein
MEPFGSIEHSNLTFRERKGGKFPMKRFASYLVLTTVALFTFSVPAIAADITGAGATFPFLTRFMPNGLRPIRPKPISA